MTSLCYADRRTSTTWGWLPYGRNQSIQSSRAVYGSCMHSMILLAHVAAFIDQERNCASIRKLYITRMIGCERREA